MKSTMSIICQFPQTITGTFTAHTRRGLFHLFNKRHYVFIQTQGIAMGTVYERAVAFSVDFMADIEKGLLMASPYMYKPLVWKRFFGLEEIC